MFKRRVPVDAGLEQIASWYSWFVSAHTARLADVPPDERARELAAVAALATAIRARLESDYRLNQRRP